ncbi:MmcQ/YjbR family DNA-binding protein [Streptomyces cellulosae]|uniref:MmcQ/YjbR family DNA-binding protein n=1 Tax=Streptomyces cellulosae TaxID=1968 RepID=UPI000689BDC4|nr:MmcQ/YjbR family DNA-binding protein [Streptomyces cellulosae]
MPFSGTKLQDTARHTALALPGVSHGRPFTEQLEVYKVAGKVFLIVTDDPDEPIVTLKAEPEYGRLLQGQYPSLTAFLAWYAAGRSLDRQGARRGREGYTAPAAPRTESSRSWSAAESPPVRQTV